MEQSWMKSHRRKTLVFLHREVKSYDSRYPTALIFVLLPSHYYTVLTMLCAQGRWNKYSLWGYKYCQNSGDIEDRFLMCAGCLRERLYLKGIKGCSICSIFRRVILSCKHSRMGSEGPLVMIEGIGSLLHNSSLFLDSRVWFYLML